MRVRPDIEGEHAFAGQEAAPDVDRLVIEWPSGHIQTFDALEAGEELHGQQVEDAEQAT